MDGTERIRVVRIRAPGDPDVLVSGEAPLPRPGAGEVRVRVAASGVNRADLIQRRGGYPAPAGFPEDVPGLEYAGIVEAVGDRCSLRAIGDPVMGITGGGAYAAAICVPERETIRAPRGLALEEAGALPEVFVTAWDALVLQAGMRAGDRVLVHAVGSGVGTAAVQLVRAAGARSIGTSRTPEKLRRARALGLDEGIVASDSWPAEVRRATAESGVDVILDLVGAAYLEGNLEALADGGRWIVVGVPSGRRGSIDLRALMAKRARVQGTVLRARPPEEKAVLARAFERAVVPLFESGVLRPVVDAVLPAEEAAEAHRRLEANETFGKVLLRW